MKNKEVKKSVFREDRMNKIVILYASVHHNNTRKLVNHIASGIQADVIDVLKAKKPDIDHYEIIILASGIYFNTVHKSLLEYIKSTSFTGKKTILLYTCGIAYTDYARSVVKILKKNGAEHIGTFHCRGFDTYGILGKIGGIAKKHPNAKDMEKILKNVKEIMNVAWSGKKTHSKDEIG